MSELLPVTVMVDSGAYTAWKLNKQINLKEYCHFLKRNEGRIGGYVALDAIPGKYGQKKGKVEFEEGARLSFENYLYMRKQGLDPIPVYHQGEEMKWLKKYLDAGATYIGVSTGKDRYRVEQRKWVDDVFTYITDSDGKPLVKTHGFAITIVDFVKRYPWTSYDSAGWAKQAASGKIIVPPLTTAGYDFTAHPMCVLVSEPRIRQNAVKYCYDSMGTVQRKYIQEYIEKIGGFTVDLVKNYVPARRAMNIIFFQQMSHALHISHFLHRRQSLWDDHSIPPYVGKAIRNVGKDIQFTIANSPTNRLCWMTWKEQHHKNHLLSYAHLTMNMRPDKALRNYIKQEGDPEQHGKSHREKVKSPPRVQFIKKEYFPNTIIQEISLPPTRVSLPEAVKLLLGRAGEGLTAAELVKRLRKMKVKLRETNFSSTLSSLVSQERIRRKKIEGEAFYFPVKK